MKVLINRRPRYEAWGGGAWFVNAAYEYLPKLGFTIIDSLSEQPDIILMVDPYSEFPGQGIGINEIAAYKLARKNECIVVHRINECDARKATNHVDSALLACQKYVDERVFVSNWLSEHLRQSWTILSPSGEYGSESICGGISNNPVIINGVDPKIYSPHHRDEWGPEVRIVTHHWSDNPMKGADVHEWIDSYLIPKYGNERFSYTFIGRQKSTLKNSKILKPMFGPRLGLALCTNDVYVSGSRSDPGPNHVLEALSCGLSVFVHQDGGGAAEFAGSDCSYKTFEDLETLLCVLPKENIQKNAHSIKLQSWEECIQKYSDLFNELTSYFP